jgi:hypothetical protein
MGKAIKNMLRNRPQNRHKIFNINACQTDIKNQNRPKDIYPCPKTKLKSANVSVNVKISQLNQKKSKKD